MCISNEEFNKQVKIILNSSEKFRQKTQHLIQKCNALVKGMTKVKSDTNIAKSVGTGVSGAGGVAMAVGLALTPFTFGTSLIVSGVGCVVTALGGATHIGTDITDIVISKNKSKKMKKSVEEWNNSAKDLRERFQEFDEICHKFLDREEFKQFFEGNDIEEAIDLIIKSFNAGKCAFSLGTGIKDLVHAIKSYKVAKNISVFSTSGNWIKSLFNLKGLDQFC